MVGFGNRLKNLRIGKSLTQKQLASMVGLATSAISAYESDSRMPTYDVMISFSRIFHVTTDYLLGVEKAKYLELSGLSDENVHLLMLLADKLRK